MFIFCNGSEMKLMFFYFLSLFYHLTWPFLIVFIPFSHSSPLCVVRCVKGLLLISDVFVLMICGACSLPFWNWLLPSPVLSSLFLSSLCLGATIAVFEAAGPTSGPVRVWEWEAPEVEGKSGKSRSQTKEGPCHEGPSGLQQTYQWQPVYVQPC